MLHHELLNQECHSLAALPVLLHQAWTYTGQPHEHVSGEAYGNAIMECCTMKSQPKNANHRLYLYSFIELGHELRPTPRLSKMHTSLPVHSTSWLSHVRSSMPLHSNSPPSVPPEGSKSTALLLRWFAAVVPLHSSSPPSVMPVPAECTASPPCLVDLLRWVAAVVSLSLHSLDGAVLTWQSLLFDARNDLSLLLGVSVPASASSCGRHAS